MRAPNARDTALRVLVSCRTAGAWADAALRAQLRRDGLSGPEAALCGRIVYGVMQNRLLLDFYLGAYCSQKGRPLAAAAAGNSADWGLSNSVSG